MSMRAMWERYEDSDFCTETETVPMQRFKTPLELWKSAVEYFKWTEATPWQYHKAVKMKNDDVEYIEQYSVPRPRYMSIVGLSSFAKTTRMTFNRYENGKMDHTCIGPGFTFSETVEIIQTIMREQKMSGAASGIFSAAIVARDIGLVDKQEVSHDLTEDFESLLNDAADD